MKEIRYLIVFLLYATVAVSCGKDFLAIKENSNQRIPNRIVDYQGMLDDRAVMNTVAAGEFAYIGSDETYVTESAWMSLGSLTQKNGYVWEREVYLGEAGNDWETGYRAILLANMALEIDKLVPSASELEAWNNVKGSALFFRAYNHYLLAQLFCKPYDRKTASGDLGIPLRLDADVTVRSKRGTLEETYRQVIVDLEEALTLLPPLPVSVNRPSKAAVYALLSRIYLIMGDYREALRHVDLCLGIKDVLLDFNTMNLNDTYLVPAVWRDNPELIFESSIPNIAIIAAASRQNMDTVLMGLYEEHDLRKRGYFRVQSGRFIFKGGYNRSAGFMGLAVDECYLIKAESHARLGEEAKALQTWNTLRRHRFDEAYFVPVEGIYGDVLLGMILLERRKELVMRGARWNDLRRLSNDPRFSEVLVRQVGSKRYELPPNDPRYVWPIPENEIDLSGIEQNIR